MEGYEVDSCSLRLGASGEVVRTALVLISIVA